MGGLQPFSKVPLNPVVIEKRIVDVEQKDGVAAGFIPMSHVGGRPGSRTAALTSNRGARCARVKPERLTPMRRPGALNDRKRLHAIDPGGETRPDDVVLDEIRPAACEPQQERHERIDRQIDRRSSPPR